MHYEISSAMPKPGKQLSATQRTSSQFSAAPRIGDRTIRRGQTLKLSETDMERNRVQIKRLYDAHAIEIVMVDGKKRVNVRTARNAPVEQHPMLTREEIHERDDQRIEEMKRQIKAGEDPAKVLGTAIAGKIKDELHAESVAHQVLHPVPVDEPASAEIDISKLACLNPAETTIDKSVTEGTKAVEAEATAEEPTPTSQLAPAVALTAQDAASPQADTARVAVAEPPSEEPAPTAQPATAEPASTAEPEAKAHKRGKKARG